MEASSQGVFGRRRSCTPLAEYAAKAHQLRQAYGLKTVLIVTDHHSQEAARNATGREIPYEIVGRRAGDIASCWADPSLATEALGWKAERGLDAMVADGWRFQSQNPSGLSDE